MPKLNCFTGTSIPELEEKFNSGYKEGMTDQEQRDLGTKILQDYHKGLHDELNGFKKSIGAKTSEYTNPDNSEKIKAINEEYKPKIEEASKPPEAPPPSGPPPREAQTGVYAERPPTELSHRGLQDVANEFSLEDVKTRDRKSDIRLRQEARETIDDWVNKGEYNKNIESLTKEAEEGNVLTDKERVILEQHLANVSERLRQTNIFSPEFNKILDMVRRLKDAGEKTRSEAGAALRIPDGGARPNTMADFMIDDMKSMGAKELTDNQKLQNKKEFEQISSAQQALHDRISQLEEQVSKMQAEKEFKKSNKGKQTPAKKTTEDYKKEREDILKNIKDKWDESKGQLSATIVPYADRLVKIAPDVARLMRSYVEEGIDKLSDLVTKIHGDIKDFIPEVTEKDVHDVIAGQYNKKAPTRNELSEQLYDLRQQAKALNKIEAIEKGEYQRPERKTFRRSAELEALRAKIKDYQKGENFKNALRKKIEKLNADIKAGRYEKQAPVKKQSEFENDPEVMRLKDNLIRLEGDRALRLAKQEYEQRSSVDKAIDAAENFLGLRRALETAFDFSLLFRQALRITLDPFKLDITAPAVKEMFKQTINPKAFDRWLHDLEHAPDYKNMTDDGLFISNPSELRLSKRDEQFRYDLASKIPIVGEGFNASQRAAASLVNKMRVDLYRKGTRMLEGVGKTRRNKPEDYKALAKLINNMTSRGHLHPQLEGAERVLGTVFFGPRLMASKFNMLSPLYYARMPKEVRIMALKNLAGATSTYLTLALLAKAAGWTISTDPDSADFLKLKHGDTRYDLTGGEAIYVRTFLRIMKAANDRLTEGHSEKRTSEAKKAVDFAENSSINFFRNKLAPNTAYIIDALTGKNSVGQPFNPYDALKYYPMWVDDIKDDWKQDKANSILYAGIPSIFGIGVQTYHQKPKNNVIKINPQQ